ncbi:hypothetical protein G5C51_41225 [Streptomyces sp. A7024]|uniref:Integral membrane protein n=1 Tax=Streptomyces coryli TaxID=1128680 RepID=A0A6G4UDR3_9ACTN|nr:DUF6350 family protein [Streptomyces coryli]NGN70293.1 hypothetical protein [Streptomyces coryli]
MTDRGPWLSAGRSPALEGPRAEAVAGLAAGALAAGLGLGFLAVLVLLFWVTSPYPDSGPGGALHVVADLWLLAHGADLVRTDTRSGLPAPVGVTPILLTAMPVWLLFRAARDALTPQDHRPHPSPRATAGWLAGGYLVVAAGVTAYAATGSTLRADVLSAAGHLPVLVAASVAAGVAAARLRLGARRRGLAVRYPWLHAVVRASAAALAVLLGCGILLFGLALAWHGAAAEASFLQLTAPVMGRIAVLLLAVALLPNAAVWAAAYTLGPGFTVGGDALVGPLDSAAHPELPFFPLLAAVPHEGAGTPLTWATAVVPAAAGLTLGWLTARSAVPVRAVREPGWTWRATLGAAAAAALACAVVLTLLAWLAGGPLGRAELASFGPSWWQTGAAAAAWTLALGLPTALAVRGWRLYGAAPVPGGWTWSVERWPDWESRQELLRELDGYDDRYDGLEERDDGRGTAV